MAASPRVPPTDPSSWSPRADWTVPLRRRPLPVALAAAAVLALLAWRIGLRPDLPAFLVLGAAGTLLGAVDIALKRLPDPLTVTSYALGALLLGTAAPFTDDGGDHLVGALVGTLALWAVFALQWIMVPGKIGLGDVKLSGVLGLYLGWLGYEAWLMGTVGMFVLAGLYAVGLLVARRASRTTELALGPFMLAATLGAICVYA